MPRRVSSWASVPPPAPEPMMTTTPWSFSSNFAMRVSPSTLLDHGPAVCQRYIGQPAQVVEPAEQVAALRERLAFVTEVFVGVVRRVETEYFHAHRREERRLLHFLQRGDSHVLGCDREARAKTQKPVLHHLAEVRVLRGIRIDALDDYGIGCVFELVV